MSISPAPLIADPEILAVPVRDCGEPLVDLCEKTSIAVLPPSRKSHPYPGYSLVRSGIAERMLLAQHYLPPGYRLRLYEGWRDLDTQQRLFDEELARVRQRFPSMSVAEAFHETTRLVSPVTGLDGQSNIPAHNTGGAVDVDLLGPDDTELDFGMPLDDWLDVPEALCETDYANISDKARFHRNLLRNAMNQVGFVNYFTEWWHYSWGDRYWAHLTRQPLALYGSCQPVGGVAINCR
jgi:D-alanyl-D-alanine dipeptidase